MVKRMMICFFVLTFILSTIGISNSFAYFEKSKWTQTPTYNQKIWQKFGFGYLNAIAGFTEVFEEPYRSVQKKEVIFIGMGRGVANGVLDTAGGLLHLVTFPVASLDIPLPEGGTDLARQSFSS